MKIRQPLDYPDSNEIEPAPPEVPVLAMWLTHPPGHKEYPVQLQLDEKGIGRCTEFQLRPELQHCQHTRDLFPNDDAA